MVLCFLTFCCPKIYGELKSGDLVFVGEGKGEFSKAITDSTGKDADSIKFVHVGIIEVKEERETFVIEASPENGVRTVELDKFLENSPCVVYKRLLVDFPVNNMLKRAKSHIDEPYDWWYLPDNGKMYCSELVYDSYLDENGNHIFEAQPMNFRAADGSMPDFWIRLFEHLGEEIPEGVDGTNPNDLSKSPLLLTLPSQ